MTGPERVVCAATEELVAEAARRFLAAGWAALEARGTFQVALAGGRTPEGLYRRLAHAAFPWERVAWWWGDERAVPPDHPDSNYRMALEALLSRVPLGPGRVHRMEAERPDGAERYAEALRAAGEGTWPVFDLVLLGMGTDGHTASLFPGSPALEEAKLPVAVAEVSGLGRRLTLTLPVLNAARAVLFLVTGAGKRPALRRVFAPGAGEPLLPAARISAPQVWLLDREADPCGEP